MIYSMRYYIIALPPASRPAGPAEGSRARPEAAPSPAVLDYITILIMLECNI